GDGLRALRAYAVEPRLAGRRPHPGQEDGGVDDHGPRRIGLRARPGLLARPGPWLRSARCSAYRWTARTRRPESDGRHRRRVLLGRLRRDLLLGGPEGRID